MAAIAVPGGYTAPEKTKGPAEQAVKHHGCRDTYGAGNETKWWVCWRVSYLACAELWDFRGGNECLVSHHLFRPWADAPSHDAARAQNT